MTRPVALIVDDEPDICELLSITLERMDIDTRIAYDLTTARRLLEEKTFKLCLTDMRLPDGNGLELVDWIATHASEVPVAVITAHGNVQSAVRALKLGAFDFVSKPVDLAVLRRLVTTALKLPSGSGQTTPVQVADPRIELIGESAAMHRVRDLVARVARSQAPVHISGESGTGKELVARLIHASGPRAGAPFVPVNCGAIPDELMESEFFGHRKGAFTGAVDDKEGLFRSADGGTLFLDEVADLPLHMQVKLLRVIQEKAVRPVGETREAPVDVRILSATHKDLAALVADAEFREDLYYRINVIELPVPPLRARGDDVGLLAGRIIERLGDELGIPVPSLSPEALRRLRSYRFPGNVRELENILERAMTLSSGQSIAADDLTLRGAPGDHETPVTGPLEDRLEDVQREAIVKALEKTRYNKTAAAKLLGMSFRALRYRIKKLGID